ncbi:hypothetical protein CKM354_001023700 [Cercospora kikuchii]|uniref:Heterokaryon incompatibility domain-containing protein n=1 Tax=Cercospora kikuchii TaxID=84275 RepID=A0A9P3CT71_9PEZI|nr:uncharacterized protein CKM354_001023700 [Cercospora kikuchii]GIZ47137.1 hypothetical protein CKM354_001023700 [Cercospora kikuchii]
MKRQVPCRWKPPPLTDSSSQIRLLWIYAGKDDEGIRCTVSVWDLEHAPEFRAISYTWGSPQSTAYINIQSVPSRPRRKAALRLYDMRVRVRENARYALWQARLHYPESYIWIDSVCIDQTDLREKTAQVAMMAKIYASAVAVLACIGPSDESSDFIYEACEDLESNAGPRDEYSNNAPRLERVQLLVGAGPADLLIEHFDKFSSRGYFHRLWILQELHSGRDRLVLCGNRVTAWKDIAWLREDLHDCHSRGWPIDDWSDQIDTLLYLLDYQGTQGEKGAYWHWTKFWNALEEFSCTDARDLVYGVLGMFDWDEADVEKPQPDYEMSTFDLAVRLIPRRPAVYEDVLGHLMELLGLNKLAISGLIQEFNASRPLEQSAGFELPEWRFEIRGIGSVGQDCYGRLCADLSPQIVTEFESANEVVCLLQSEIQVDRRDDMVLPSSNGREPVRIYTGGTVSVVAWSEVKPDDILVQIANQVLVGRIIDASHFRVVGNAIVLSNFDWKRFENWTCTCWPEQSAIYSRFRVLLSSTDLSHAEALMLSGESSDGSSLSSRVKRSRLSTPAIGTVFKDITYEVETGTPFGIRPIKETCALHNAEECNQWLEYPMRFAAASGCGPRFHQAHTVFKYRSAAPIPPESRPPPQS